MKIPPFVVYLASELAKATARYVLHTDRGLRIHTDVDEEVATGSPTQHSTPSACPRARAGE